MARVWNNCVHPKRVFLIWVLSLFLFFFAFYILRKNSSLGSYNSTHCAPMSNMEQRTRMYDKMARDLNEHRTAFLKHGKTSQSLSLHDLFIVKDGFVTPNPKPANPPLRANVLYPSPEYSAPISNAVQSAFSPYFDREEIKVEANAVKSVVQSLYPLRIVLERVILTSTGVLLGWWQIWEHFDRRTVNSGTDPTTICAKLRSALPHAPEKQLYDAAILHTSFAWILGPPKVPDKERHRTSDDVQLFHELVARLSNKIRGFQAVVTELWYVEELDVLALALDGRMKVRRFQLGLLTRLRLPKLRTANRTISLRGFLTRLRSG